MDTQNEALENVSPFEYGHFMPFLGIFGIHVKFLGCMYVSNVCLSRSACDFAIEDLTI